MATAFDTPVAPFAGTFTDLPTQFLEASTRAISASAELYTQVLTTQAEATRSLLEAFSGAGTQAVATGAQATEQAAETTTRTARTAARTTARATRGTARTAKSTTRRAAGTARRATKAAAQAAAPKPPIAGYDDLTADEIVAKLPQQPQTALAQIATYEAVKENRSTVLQRVAALTGPEPAPGYDELTADDAQKLVANGSADLAATVRDYERRHKDRASVVESAVRHADSSAS